VAWAASYLADTGRVASLCGRAAAARSLLLLRLWLLLVTCLLLRLLLRLRLLLLSSFRGLLRLCLRLRLWFLQLSSCRLGLLRLRLRHRLLMLLWLLLLRRLLLLLLMSSVCWQQLRRCRAGRRAWWRSVG